MNPFDGVELGPKHFISFTTTPSHSTSSAVISVQSETTRTPHTLVITRSCGSVDRIVVSHAAVEQIQDVINRLEEDSVASGGNEVVPHQALKKRCQEDRAMVECVLGLTRGTALRGTMRPRSSLSPLSHHAKTTPTTTLLGISDATGTTATSLPPRPNSSMSLPPPAHPSPDEWASETVTAVNARTKYSPYERRAHSASPSGPLDAVTQERMVHRLYNVAVDSKNKFKNDMEQKLSRTTGENERRVLTSDEQRDLGDRLYYKQRQHTLQTITRLKEMYCQDRPPSRILTRIDREEQCKRLYYDTTTKSKAIREQLMKTYVDSTQVQSKKLSREKISEMANRLSTYKKFEK